MFVMEVKSSFWDGFENKTKQTNTDFKELFFNYKPWNLVFIYGVSKIGKTDFSDKNLWDVLTFHQMNDNIIRFCCLFHKRSLFLNYRLYHAKEQFVSIKICLKA